MAQLIHESILSKQDHPQDGCPLFCVLPGEVRDSIFSYVLTDHPDPTPSMQFSEKTCYTRPSYQADQATDTRLLRTCRAIYREAWFKPFLLRELTQWASSGDRAPPSRPGGPASLRRMLKRITKQQNTDKVEMERLRVFAQMYKLEEGDLKAILRLPHLAPRTVTLTIRHTDWWYWESDEPLHFEGNWIEGVSGVMSSSTNKFCIELESLERKKDQVDKIADQMIKKWYFKRKDGAVLYAEASGATRKESRWSGSSTWHNQRWVRDETEPGRLDYYIVSVTFRPQIDIERSGGSISEAAFDAAQKEHFDAAELKLHLPGQSRIEDEHPYRVVYDSYSDDTEEFLTRRNPSPGNLAPRIDVCNFDDHPLSLEEWIEVEEFGDPDEREYRRRLIADCLRAEDDELEPELAMLEADGL